MTRTARLPPTDRIVRCSWLSFSSTVHFALSGSGQFSLSPHGAVQTPSCALPVDGSASQPAWQRGSETPCETVFGSRRRTGTHTSPETKEVAEKYAKLIEESLRSSGDIGDPSAEDQILYSSFDNTQRADFLLSLTGDCHHEELAFVRLTNLEALTDTTQQIPDDCKDLIEGFEQLRLRGELHKSAYCRRREIYPFVRFYRMDARFKFKVKGAEGECIIRYEFADYGTSQNQKAEFTHETEVSNLADKFKHVSKADVKKPLQELVARVVAERFKERNTRKQAAPPTASRTRTRKHPVPQSEQTGNLFDLKSP